MNRYTAQHYTLVLRSSLSFSKHLLKMGVRAMGLQSFNHVILFFFGMGTMVDFLKHEGTTDSERERLKMSVKTPASWNAHARSTEPGMLSGPTALRIFTVGRIGLHPRQKWRVHSPLLQKLRERSICGRCCEL